MRYKYKAHQSSDCKSIVDEDDNNMLGFMQKKPTVHGGSISEVDRYLALNTDEEVSDDLLKKIISLVYFSLIDA
jgi:hypothetical protein